MIYMKPWLTPIAVAIALIPLLIAGVLIATIIAVVKA